MRLYLACFRWRDKKQANGEPVTAQDLKDLTMTMLQKSTLPKEVLEAMKNDPEAFEELADDIKAVANRLIHENEKNYIIGNNDDLKGLLGFDWPLSKSDIVNENGGGGVQIGSGFINEKGKITEKTNDSASPVGKVIDEIFFKGDPNTTVNVNGKSVSSQSAWVDIMDYGNAENHPEQWAEMINFSDKKHYGEDDDDSKVDLNNKYNNGNNMTWYGPNTEFIVDDVNIGDNKYQGTSIKLSILDENGNISGKVELGHLTEINKDIFNAEKGITKFDAGTILGKTNRIIGCSTGLHLHMRNFKGDRQALYKLMSGR